MSPWLITPLLLVASNVLMIFAWYGHLKAPHWPMWVAIGVSWGIAFFEYCLAVPANRIGYGTFTAQQLKVMQEVITLMVFMGFAAIYFGTKPQWNHFAAFACILAAVLFTVLPGRKT